MGLSDKIFSVSCIVCRHDSDFLHDLGRGSGSDPHLDKNNCLKSALDFIQERTHFWQVTFRDLA